MWDPVFYSALLQLTILKISVQLCDKAMTHFLDTLTDNVCYLFQDYSCFFSSKEQLSKIYNLQSLQTIICKKDLLLKVSPSK